MFRKLSANSRLTLTALLLVFALALAACGGGGAGGTGGTGGSGSGGSGSGGSGSGGGGDVASDAQSDEELILGSYQEFTILDPHKSSASFDAQALHAIFDRLLEINGDTGELVAGLATEYSVSDDDLVWTLKLKEGVTFHDGTPFNAEAVKYNLDRIADPATMSEYAVFQLGPYKETVVVDEYTVEIHMNSPYGALPTALATYGMGMVSPTHVEKVGSDAFGQNPVGTGAFKFVEWVQNSHLTLERNDDYTWGPEFHTREKIYFKRITIKPIIENATRAAALERGEIHASNNMGAAQWLPFAEDPDNWGVEQFLRHGYPPPALFINTQKAPTNDLEVRRAIIEAVDFALLNDVVYEGTQVKSGGVMSSHAWAWSEKAGNMYEYDAAASGARLEAAGWKLNESTGVREKDGQELELVYLSLSGVKNVAEVIEPMLREVGFKVTLRIEDNPAQQKTAQSGEHNLVWTQWGGVDPSQLKQVYACANIGGGWNFSHYCNERFEELMKQGDEETDREKREAIYKEVQELLLEDATLVPLNNSVLLWAFEKDLEGWGPTEATGFGPYFNNVYRKK